MREQAVYVLFGVVTGIFVVGCTPAHTPVRFNIPPAELDSQAKFRVDQSALDSPEWREAIQKATQHQADMGQYTLLRVIMKDASPTDIAQLEATKLKVLTAKYHGGGGQYRTAPSYGFVLWQHINSTRRRANKEPIHLGHYKYGEATLWVDVPPAGELNVLGNVILEPCPLGQRGKLEVKVKPKRGVKMQRFVIGPVVVGGPYGTSFRLYPDGTSEAVSLAPGNYKILFPDFDYRKSRWEFSVYPSSATRLKLRAKSQKEIEMKRESYQPFLQDM